MLPAWSLAAGMLYYSFNKILMNVQLSLGIINNERLNLLYKLNELQEAYMSFANAIPMHGDLITLLCSGSVSLTSPREKIKFLEKASDKRRAHANVANPRQRSPTFSLTIR